MQTIDLAGAVDRGNMPIKDGDIARGLLRRPAVLCCTSGKMLVTIEGDWKDYQLDEGGILILPSRKLVIAEGIADFSITAVCREKTSADSPMVRQIRRLSPYLQRQ